MLLSGGQSYRSNSSRSHYDLKGQGTSATASVTSSSLLSCCPSLHLYLPAAASTCLSLPLPSACACPSDFPAGMGSPIHHVLSSTGGVRPRLTIFWSWLGNQHRRQSQADARPSSLWAYDCTTPWIAKSHSVGTAWALEPDCLSSQLGSTIH